MRKPKDLNENSVTNEELIDILEFLLEAVRKEVKKLEKRVKKLEEK